ncbi:hypothetical protein KI387_023318, partial [Taxus chinensis]
VRMKNKLPKSVLSERVKWLDDNHVDNVFRGFRPMLSASDMNKALRARKRLATLASRKEEKRAAALAAGLEWQSDSDIEELPEPMIKEPPLPNLLKDEEHYQLIVEICKALASLRRYWEALEIINHSLKLGHNHFSQEKQDELRSLGAQVAYNTTDPKNGYDCARYIVQQHPYSLGAWNCYYKVVSRLESRVGKHGKFMLAMRAKYPDCVPPMVICGHQFAMISQSQGALREYLEAYKTQPDNPLINLCVGTSFINLALGFRVNNRNQCVVQGFAFLYNYKRLCKNNQESNYNLARAYQHVGLIWSLVCGFGWMDTHKSFITDTICIRVRNYSGPWRWFGFICGIHTVCIPHNREKKCVNSSLCWAVKESVVVIHTQMHTYTYARTYTHCQNKLHGDHMIWIQVMSSCRHGSHAYAYASCTCIRILCSGTHRSTVDRAFQEYVDNAKIKNMLSFVAYDVCLSIVKDEEVAIANVASSSHVHADIAVEEEDVPNVAARGHAKDALVVDERQRPILHICKREGKASFNKLSRCCKKEVDDAMRDYDSETARAKRREDILALREKKKNRVEEGEMDVATEGVIPKITGRGDRDVGSSQGGDGAAPFELFVDVAVHNHNYEKFITEHEFKK